MKLIQLVIDGQTVNWNVLELLDEHLVEKGHKKSTGSCSQHIIHGSFQTGVMQTQWEIKQVLKGLFWLPYKSLWGRATLLRFSYNPAKRIGWRVMKLRKELWKFVGQ